MMPHAEAVTLIRFIDQIALSFPNLTFVRHKTSLLHILQESDEVGEIILLVVIQDDEVHDEKHARAKAAITTYFME